MDVPYNKSGASSRAHYQIVRNVENAPHLTEKLVRQEVERIRQRIAGKLLSTSELRKDLIVLLYCLNSSTGSVNSKILAFALPSAVHLAEAGSRVSEKRIGYLFCWEVMPREHELQLMLVNTIRKDLTSSSVARINLALESLVNLPSADVIPAVHTRCIELLTHPSVRIRILTMKALQSFARFAPDTLHGENIKRLVLKRLEDGDDGAVRAALRFGLFLAENDFLESEEIMRACISLITRLSEKQSSKTHSSTFVLDILSIILRLYAKEGDQSQLDHAKVLLPTVFTILRQAVRHDRRALILECFRLLGRFPSSAVSEYIIKLSVTSPSQTHSQEQEGSSDGRHAQFVHPVARTRHFLSSRTVNDHYLFLSCLVCLDPSLWAGTGKSRSSEKLLGADDGQQTGQESGSSEGSGGIPPVLDQLEVERVLTFLESDDDEIRTLTLRILMSLDTSLVEACHSRALDALKASVASNAPNGHSRDALLWRCVELASTITLGNEKLDVDSRSRTFVEKLHEVIQATGMREKVNGAIVEAVLIRVRREGSSAQYACILSLFSLLHNEGPDQSAAKSMNSTLLIILVALTCEFASVLVSSSGREVLPIICFFATILHDSPLSLQELIILCMTRLFVLLTPEEMSSLQMEDVRRVIHELGEVPPPDKPTALLAKRCQQFEKVLVDANGIRQLLVNKEFVSLPEFALLLDQEGRGVSSPASKPSPSKSITPSLAPSTPEVNSVRSPSLSQSKLRYDAYELPRPTSSVRMLRAHSQSSATSSRNSNRAPSRASSSRYRQSEDDAEGLSRTVTAGELTLAASKDEYAPTKRYQTEKGEMRETQRAMANAELGEPVAKTPADLLSIDSPFLPEPLVDVNVNTSTDNTLLPSGTPPPSSPYVSASTSLRTSPEPGPNFDVLWSELDAFKARGWCEEAVDVVVRRLQGLGMSMVVLDAELPPFAGDLKLSLRTGEGASPNAAIRIHEEEDGSCLWQVKSRDKDVGLRVKELLKS